MARPGIEPGTSESDALPTALRGPAKLEEIDLLNELSAEFLQVSLFLSTQHVYCSQKINP